MRSNSKIEEYIKTETLAQSQLQKNWRVVLYNDEEHTYDYVVEMLMEICRFSRNQAFRCAVEIDLTGKSAVFYGKKDDCEVVAAKIHGWGPDHRLLHSRTSMQCAVLSQD